MVCSFRNPPSRAFIFETYDATLVSGQDGAPKVKYRSSLVASFPELSVEIRLGTDSWRETHLLSPHSVQPPPSSSLSPRTNHVSMAPSSHSNETKGELSPSYRNTRAVVCCPCPSPNPSPPLALVSILPSQTP